MRFTWDPIGFLFQVLAAVLLADFTGEVTFGRVVVAFFILGSATVQVTYKGSKWLRGKD